MSRSARIALPFAIAVALTAVAAFDLRLAIETSAYTVDANAILDEHERRLNGTKAVTPILDEHERRLRGASR